ncbi:MAG: BamA/TamA family outer membrane protein [candidate division KSB1 bacterium]|nr:BamA/TamA family outer membrane protein [candidate division KSB1 bacterium]
MTDVEIHGAEHVSQSQILSWANWQLNKPLNVGTLEKSCRDILQHYSDAGYPYARIDSLIFILSADTSQISLLLYITEGQKLKTAQLYFENISESEKNLLNQSIDGDQVALSSRAVEEKLERALDEFERRSFPFIRFEPTSIRIDSTRDPHSFVLHFKTLKGPKLIIREIQVVGNEFTHKKVITREIRIKEGDFFDARRTAKIQSRLMRLGYFRRVDPPEVFLATEDEGGLLIRVEEGNSSRFDGVVGYTPGTGDEKGYFTGLIDLQFGNLFGTGRALSAHWQKRDRSSQDLVFRFREPWIAGFPVHASTGFQQLIQDSSYVTREWGVDVELPLLESLSFSASVKQNSVLPDSSAALALLIPRSRATVLGLSLIYDTRDDIINPRRGIYYSTTVQSAAKTNTPFAGMIALDSFDKKATNRSYLVDLDLFIPTLKRQVINLSLHARQLNSTQKIIPMPDLFRMGGTRSLRGYREDQFRGSVVAWSNVEYRYLLGRRSRAFVFLDTGYYSLVSKEKVKKEEIKIGYGFGFRLESGLGILSLDYGLAYGEKQGLMGGLLHVGLINEF